MHPLIELKSATLLFLIVLVFIWPGLMPKAQAVSPPPDGGYPGGNTAEGQAALLSLMTGGFNTAVGFLSLRANTTSSFNTAIGAGTLLVSTTDNNTAIGAAALLRNNIGSANTATGTVALFYNTEGSLNTANGYQALYSNTNGSLNTAIGNSTLLNNATGTGNTAIGFAAGLSITGSGNVCLGASLDGVAAVNDTTWIRNVYSSVATARPVYVNSSNKIGTLSSSRRYKEEIKSMSNSSEALFALKPVTFRYKKQIDPTQTLSFGLIAEEVAEIDPELITRDKNGKPETVRYEAVNAMLLNEFLKEHRRVREQRTQIDELNSRVAIQEATIARQRKDFETTVTKLKKDLETVVAHLKEQDANLQKVSAQIDTGKSAPHVVLNNP